MSSTVYDFAIVGAGAAGLHLALAILKDPYFNEKSVLILEKDNKSRNDRTWCFWEAGKGQWEEIINHRWAEALFYGKGKELKLDLAPYTYKMVRGIDFYNFAKKQISKTENISWIKDEATEVINSNEEVLIRASNGEYKAKHVFDSRITLDQDVKARNYNLTQHFKGYFIETKEKVFNKDAFTMMDYRVKYKSDTSFTYVLPFSETEALVEFTLFNEEILSEQEYDNYLQRYFNEILKLNDFKILETERGQIPMSTYPFYLHHQDKVSKIGTAGGWVRPSSGYSFKNAERYSQQIITNIKNDKVPHEGVAVNRFRRYDFLFLDVLKHKNYLGERLFTQMYDRNSSSTLFSFLDEQTNFLQELVIMAKFEQKPFFTTLMKEIYHMTFK